MSIFDLFRKKITGEPIQAPAADSNPTPDPVQAASTEKNEAPEVKETTNVGTVSTVESNPNCEGKRRVHNLLVLLRESSPEARVRAAPHAHNLFSRHVLYAAVVGEHHAHHSCELRGAVLVKTSVNYRDAAS